MEIKLKNKDGREVVISGDEESVLNAASKLGVDIDESKFHYSESRKGYMAISSMHPAYKRNAVLKSYKAWLDKAREAETPAEFYQLMLDGPYTDKGLVAMVASLRNVESWE